MLWIRERERELVCVCVILCVNVCVYRLAGWLAGGMAQGCLHDSWLLACLVSRAISFCASIVLPCSPFRSYLLCNWTSFQSFLTSSFPSLLFLVYCCVSHSYSFFSLLVIVVYSSCSVFTFHKYFCLCQCNFYFHFIVFFNLYIIPRIQHYNIFFLMIPLI